MNDQKYNGEWVEGLTEADLEQHEFDCSCVVRSSAVLDECMDIFINTFGEPE